MAFDAEKFAREFPADEMKKQMETAAENNNDYEELPDGEYTVKLELLELGESSKGAAMLKARFRITEGDHKKQCIFVNKVLTGTKNDGFMLFSANEFLKSLEAVNASEVVFENWKQYEDLILDIGDIADEDAMRYVIDYQTNEKNPKYHDVDIIMVL